MTHRILVADDEEASRDGLASILSNWGYEVAVAEDGREALERALSFQPAVTVADLVMPGMDGLVLLKTLRSELPSSTVILLTGHGTIDSAVAAVKEGAYDYLTKPVDLDRMRLILDKAVEQSDVLHEVTLLRRQLTQTRGLGPLIGASPDMQHIYHLIELAAATSAPVLILGESGTGKELVARTIHQLSPRRNAPFVAVNCAAIPETLLESELFGYEKGAFTGALGRRAGYFELADKGTIFLDEISEMTPALQAKYLRTLQDGTVRRLGGHALIQVDLRIIAATNTDPIAAIKDGRFREDLYYRLNVFSISMPPLRHRKQDIPLLVEAFINEFSEKYGKPVTCADDAAMRLLGQHSWPGNVRELRNWIERAVISSGGDRITAEHLPPIPSAEDERPASDAVTLSIGVTVDEAERQLILKTLASVENNRTRAAEILGMSAKTLYNKLKRYKTTDEGE
ncbi:MAG TPA: sigma-54 dependent transcriptional regulator [Methylomirabilota bacterium]|jgi:DNA-binding NtrC family response regulator|nr:sigma-54 dependent transcriptional regulator [Methylomirabilota bacterium]